MTSHLPERDCSRSDNLADGLCTATMGFDGFRMLSVGTIAPHLPPPVVVWMNNTMHDGSLEFSVISLPHRHSGSGGPVLWTAGCVRKKKSNIDSWRQVGPVGNASQLAKRKKRKSEHAASNNGTSHQLAGWLAVFPSFLDPYEFPALPCVSLSLCCPSIIPTIALGKFPLISFFW